MNHNIRVVEIPSKEVYIDANDLIIELLIKANNTAVIAESKVYKELADRLSMMRDRAHKAGVNVIQDQKL
jgi:hypothetical protein